MNELYKIKNSIAEKINKALGKKIVQASDLVYPPQADMGDLSLPCFQLAKELSKSPAEIATQIVGNIETKEELSGVKVLGSYVNFSLNKKYLASEILRNINKDKEKFGENKNGKNEKVMLEFSNGNTHKEYHIGHLRNISFGDSVTKILKANGYDAMPVSYINDFGIHVAKTVWWTFHPDQKEDLEKVDNKGYFLGKMYVEANRREKEDQTAKPAINFVMQKIESRQGKEYELWQKTRQWSIDYFQEISKELGISFNHIFYESEVIERGRKIVDELLEKGILEKSDGAVIANLGKYDLGVLVVLRSDGTYPSEFIF